MDPSEETSKLGKLDRTAALIIFDYCSITRQLQFAKSFMHVEGKFHILNRFTLIIKILSVCVTSHPYAIKIYVQYTTIYYIYMHIYNILTKRFCFQRMRHSRFCRLEIKKICLYYMRIIQYVLRAHFSCEFLYSYYCCIFINTLVYKASV